jgi:pimeloyl-ACP methyl ester carboxylesterase
VAEANGWTELQVRVHGAGNKPTLIYLPGLHGDWTLVGSFRAAVAGRVRFVEFTYPRTQTWSLREHAEAILTALKNNGVNEGWILAESFGSVLAWTVLELVEERGFHVQGLILAGGFVRYPVMGLVGFAKRINERIPMWLVGLLCRIYARYAQFRHRHAPETLAEVNEFLRRRIEPEDRRAFCHRYTLIRQSDARKVAAEACVPIYQLCGFFDPIVPWPFVRAWLKRECANCRGWKMIWNADHNVLGTAPKAAAEQVLNWMNASA